MTLVYNLQLYHFTDCTWLNLRLIESLAEIDEDIIANQNI